MRICWRVKAAEIASGPASATGSRSVSTCVARRAADNPGAKETLAVAGESERFHNRAITPRSMPSSAGFTAQRRTFGSLTVRSENVSAGKGPVAVPMSAPVTNGFWCSSANFMAAT